MQDGFSNRRAESPERANARAWAAICAAILAASRVLDPRWGGSFTICPFKNLTGLPCAGCGLSHAFEWIARGRLDRAIHANALSPIVFAGVVAALIWNLARLRGWRPPPAPAFPLWSKLLLIAAVALWWGIRLKLGI